jgi:hypothetical protein
MSVYGILELNVSVWAPKGIDRLQQEQAECDLHEMLPNTCSVHVICTCILGRPYWSKILLQILSSSFKGTVSQD